jgi:hypothetical protein
LARLDVLVGPDDSPVALAGEEVPAPVHKGTDFLFGAVEQRQMDAEPGEPDDVHRDA